MLKLGDSFVTFEACSTASDIFFDDLNQRICTVRGNGEMGITSKGLTEGDIISFRIPDQGQIKSLNFSPDSQIVTVRRERSAIDFVFLITENNISPPIVRQACRCSYATILGAQWINERQLIFVLDQGLELYSINCKKQYIKFIKSIDVTVHWFVSYTPSQLIFLSNGLSNSILNPFLIQSNVIHRLSRFEVDFGCSSIRPKLLDRDITIASIYERISILVLKSGQRETFMEHINIYEFSSTDPFVIPQLTKVLCLNLDGFIGVHVIDNAIFVHHKNSSTSIVFEVGELAIPAELSPAAFENKLKTYKTPQILLPLCISKVEVTDELRDSFKNFGGEVSLYSSSSAIFAPNFIADVRFGFFTTLNFTTQKIVHYVTKYNLLLDFLIKRTNAEDIFLKVFKSCLLTKSIKISKIIEIFHQILKTNNTSSTSTRDLNTSRCHFSVIPIKRPVIDYNTILRNVFDPLRNCDAMDKKFLSYLVLEFFLIVKRMKISLEQNYLPEFLLRVLVDAKQFNKLHQLLQYGVIDDSKFLAFELVSLGNEYKPLYQMAIDMLARRDNMEQISEMLISQNKVIEAVRCIAVENHYRKTISLDRKHCLKLLEGAWKTNNRQIMYTVFTHLKFAERVKYLDGSYEDFEQFIKDFEVLFKEEEIVEAEKRFRLAKISSISRKSRATSDIENKSTEDNVSINESIGEKTSEENTDYVT